MRKLLWVGDAGVPSGFAKATHAVLDVLRETFDVTVLGINYRGDPHSYPYPIYAAAVGGDAFGVGRLVWMMDLVKPDVVMIQNDPWNFPPYLKRLKQFYPDVPVIGFVAVDGLNCAGESLNDLTLAIFWTQFGETEARNGGFVGKSAIVPLAVDTSIYKPGDRRQARIARGIPEYLLDSYIVGNVNRNQPRKRLDLTVRYFAEWVKHYAVEDAYLYLHIAPTGDAGYACEQLAGYYGVLDRLMVMQPETFYGISEVEMADTYRMFDAQITTTQGEGFGLTTLEGMACGIPQIAPKWAALGELVLDASVLVPCTSTSATFGNINVIGGVPDQKEAIAALRAFHADPSIRAKYSEVGLKRIADLQLCWRTTGELFRDALKPVFAEVALA